MNVFGTYGLLALLLIIIALDLGEGQGLQGDTSDNDQPYDPREGEGQGNQVEGQEQAVDPGEGQNLPGYASEDQGQLGDPGEGQCQSGDLGEGQGQSAERDRSNHCENTVATNNAVNREPTNSVIESFRRIETAPSSYVDYRFEDNRLRSFTLWPASHIVTAEDLANAGFYYQGTEDRVQCHFCRGMLRNWEAGDLALGEHARHFPTCPFIANSRDTSNVPIGEDRLGRMNVNIRNVIPDQNNSESITNRPIHQEYCSLSARRATFQNFHPDNWPSRDQLSRAGFYYTGERDRVRCFYCDVDISNWGEKDDPWRLHSIYSPSCPHVRNCKEEDSLLDELTDGLFINERRMRENIPQKRRRQKIAWMYQSSTSQVCDTVPEEKFNADTESINLEMGSELVLAALAMGLEIVTVREIVRRRLQELGNQFPNIESLVNSYYEYEESTIPSQGDGPKPVSKHAQPSSVKNKSQVEFVDGEKMKSYTCIVCKKVLFSAMMLFCGHRACQPCVQKLKSCPGGDEECKTIDVDKGTCFPDFGARRDMKNLNVFCINSQYGCDVTCKWSQLESHLVQCQYVPTHCRYADRGCKIVLPLIYLKKHEKIHHNVSCSIDTPRLNALDDGKTCDGKFIWKIPGYKNKKANALSGRQRWIYSIPFYSSRSGYKLRLCLYLNGDGMGENTHLSLYLVVMRGEYDSLLQWPIGHRVQMTLLDQEKQQRHISDAFRPDPTSRSFQRPVTEYNISSGFPLFVTQSVAESSTYLKNDTLFIRVQLYKP